MKKIVVKVIIASLLLGLIGFSTNSFALTEFTLGDIDGNNEVNANDLKVMSKHISDSRKNKSNEWIMTGEKYEAADINRDGKVNVRDVMSMISYFTTKRNPHNIGKKFQIDLENENEDYSTGKQNEPTRVYVDIGSATEENIEINPNKLKEEIDNKKIESNTVAINVMKEKILGSNIVKFEKDKIEIKTNEVEKLNIVTENKNDPITLKSSDTNVVELYGVGIAVGKNAGEAIITAEQGNEKAQCKIIVIDRNEEVNNIKLNKEKIDLEVGETEKLQVNTDPINKEVRWSTSNSEILEVKEDGTIISKKPGLAAVYATSGKQRATCIVNVKDKNIPIQEVSIDKEKIELIQGETKKIMVRIVPSNATIKEIELVKDNDNIKIDEKKVKVNEKGIAEINITGEKTGSTTLIVRAGEKESKNIITIKEAEVEKLSLDTSEINMEENQLRRITATIEPETASSKKITWTSDKSDVISVDENGLIKSHKVGEATITATAGNKTATCKVKAENKKVSVREIKISSNNISVKEDQTTKLTVELGPANATNKELNIKLNNDNSVVQSEKVTVENNGKAEITIIGKKEGKSILTISSGTIVEKCNITITKKEIPVSKITMSTGEINIDKGKTKKITVKIEPANATNKEITLKTNNSNISIDKTKATARKDGSIDVSITGKKAGNATLTASSGGKSTNCKVKINAIVEKISLSESKIELVEEKTKKIKATITPSNAVNKEITWKSNNDKIATVDKNGKVKAIKEGTVTITATAGGISAKCTVNVKAKEKLINVLFIGNSKTFANEAQARFQKLANSAGRKVHAERIDSYGGRTLNTLSTYDSVKNKIKSKKWDYIVLQEQTDTSIGSTQPIMEGCYNLIQYAKKYSNKNVIPIYNATWVVKTSNQSTQNIVNNNFETIRKKYGGKVAYSGNAFIKCSKQHTNIQLYTDDRHPTIAGQYLSACCVYVAIYGKTPVGIKQSEGNAISAENTKKLQQIAAKVMGV